MRVPLPAASHGLHSVRGDASTAVCGSRKGGGSRPADAHEGLGMNEGLEVARRRGGRRSRSRPRAWARLAALATMADRRALRAAAESPARGGGGGDAVEDVLALGMDLGGLVEDLEGVLELPAIVEEDAVVQEVLEGLGTEGWPAFRGPSRRAADTRAPCRGDRAPRDTTSPGRPEARGPWRSPSCRRP